MKNLLYQLAIVFSCLGLVSCVNEIADPEEMIKDDVTSDIITITAAANGGSVDTKNVINDDLKVSWEGGDEISVFYGNVVTGSRFTTFSSGEVAEFTGSINTIVGGGEGMTDDTYLWGVYPYSESTKYDGKYITLTLPHEQRAKAGSFASGLFPQIAKSQNFFMSFYNLCCCIRFKVSNPDIVKVTLFGNNGEELAGQALVSMDKYPVVEKIQKGSTKLVMDAPNKGYFEVDKYYYFVLYPTDFQNGLTIVYHKKDSQASYSNNNSFTLERNTCSDLDNADKDLKFMSTENLDVKGETLNVPWSYRYHDGGSDHRLHPHSLNNGKAVVLNVDTEVDLTKMDIIDPWGNQLPLADGCILEATATNNVGESILENNRKIIGPADIRATSANTISFSPHGLTYSTCEVNYKYRFTLVDQETGAKYSAGFNVELGPKPYGKPIHLGNFATEGSLSRDVKINSAHIFDAVLQTDKDFYSDIIPGPEALDNYEIWNNGWEEVENRSMRPDITYLERPRYEPVFDKEGVLTNYRPVCSIWVTNPGTYEGYYWFCHAFSFYGITYEFNANINLVKPTFNLSINSERVDENNELTLTGNGQLPSYKDGVFTDYVKGNVLTTDLRSLVNVDGVRYDNCEEVDIVYELKSIITDQMGNPNEIDGVFFAHRTPAYYRTVENNTLYLKQQENIMDWWGNIQPDGSRPDNITIRYKLVSSADEKIVFDSEEIRINAVSPDITLSSKNKTITSEFGIGETAKANVAKALQIKTGDKIMYNAKAKSFDDLFDFTYADENSNIVTLEGGYNIYDIHFDVDPANVKMKLESSGTIVNLPCSFDQNTGDFYLEFNNANIVDNIIATIPVNMTYAFQGDDVQTAYVTVKFERVEESEIFSPELGQWSYDSPDFWGNVRTILYLYDNCGIVRSIEDEYINNQGISEEVLRGWGWNGEWGEIATRIKDFSITPRTSTSGAITGTYVISSPWGGEYEEPFEIQYSNCTGNSMDIICEELCIGKWDDSNTLQPVTATKLEEKVMIVELNPNIPTSGQWAIFTESGEDTGWLLDLGVDNNGAAIAQSFESQGISEEELVEYFGWNGEWGYKILEFTEYRVEPETKTSGTIYLTASGRDLWDEPIEEIIEIHYTNSMYAQTMNISSDWFGFDNFQAILYGNKEYPLELMTINNGMEPLGVR